MQCEVDERKSIGNLEHLGSFICEEEEDVENVALTPEIVTIRKLPLLYDHSGYGNIKPACSTSETSWSLPILDVAKCYDGSPTNKI